MSALGEALALELLAALRDPQTAAALAAELRPVLRPVLGEELRRALAEHAADRHLDIPGAAKHCGTTATAFRQRLATDPELQRLRLGAGRLTRFRVSDLDLWLARRQSQKKRRGAPASES